MFAGSERTLPIVVEQYFAAAFVFNLDRLKSTQNLKDIWGNRNFLTARWVDVG
jgi:hypothetical protein